MAAGLPIVAADAPQNREVLGDAGSAVPPTPEAFARALQAIPAVPDERARAVARRRAQRFSIAAQAERMEEVYAGLVAGEAALEPA